MKARLLIPILLLALPLMAQTAHDTEARRFFRLNTPESEVKGLLQEQIGLILPIFTDALEEGLGFTFDQEYDQPLQDLLAYLFDEEMDYQQIEDLSVPLIKNQFSLEELRQLNAFFQSPAGAKYLREYQFNTGSYLAKAMEDYFTKVGEDEEFIDRVGSRLLNVLLETMSGVLDGLEEGAAEGLSD